MPATTRLITYGDSLDMPESRLEEVVNGELRVMPPPSVKHQELVDFLADGFKRQLDRKAFRVLQGCGLGIRMTPTFTYRVPDLAVYRRDAMVMKDDYYIWSPPELLVEVYSRPYRKGNLDDLLSDYANIGVPELWLADTDQRLLTSLRLEGQRLQEFQTLSSGSVSPIRLPSVLVQIERLWHIPIP